MVSSKFTVIISIVTANIIFDIAYAHQKLEVVIPKQVDCLRSIAEVFDDYKFKNVKKVDYNELKNSLPAELSPNDLEELIHDKFGELNKNKCIEIAVYKLSKNLITHKYSETNVLVDGLSYYYMMPRTWIANDVLTPQDFCIMQAGDSDSDIIDENKSTECWNQLKTHLPKVFGNVVDHLFDDEIDFESFKNLKYGKLYVQHVAEKLQFREVMDPVDFCLNKYMRQRDESEFFEEDLSFAKKLNLN